MTLLDRFGHACQARRSGTKRDEIREKAKKKGYLKLLPNILRWAMLDSNQ